jgi:nicotinate phosphoribosyltransferase
LEGHLGNVDARNLALATDLYELTMAAAYYNSDCHHTKGIFEMFVRKLPRNRSYLVTCGLEQALYFLMSVRFNEEELSYIKSLEVFKYVEDFFEYLRNFKFTGTVWAVPEGTILFPNEPVIRIEAPIIEAQIVEQSLIATKASLIIFFNKTRGWSRNKK